VSTDYSSLLNFEGQVAIITGAAQGLGAEFARAFAECGATVVLLDVDSERVHATASRIGARAVAMQCDVQDKSQVESCVAKILESNQRIDILVSNAGIHRHVDPLGFDVDDVEAIFAVNMIGCLNVCGTVGKVMIEQGSGKIVNISALGGGLIGLGRAGSAYGMSKGGVVSLTRDLAAEWTKHGVRVNAVAPGWIRTPMTSALQDNPERSALMLQRVPAQRWGEPEDVARVVLFLASDGSSYISGHTIPIDGGAANVIAFP
jgi:NAD(P)-dependent dehydrogenase (short-subunit alcohol dehydrogenase family)